MFSYKCTACGGIHEGIPSYAALAPLSYEQIPESERAARAVLGSDDCVIDETTYFVRGCIDIPVDGDAEPFIWGVWVSLSEASFMEWGHSFDLEKRSHIGPFVGWLDTELTLYPTTVNLKARVRLRDGFARPSIELEQNGHPLAIEQRDGISRERLADILTLMRHGPQ
ncbi:DUF2199 domain-containing protein [Massilia sp. CCM 8734]|uniref:DUF2199 domain-containing protein n=1 Tax=Massilia sp. CCM 8734 TaxID=2609283 RepID=UPI001421AADB|nr:DUF2199 domain-containing protein [Massilia sp. CCM 8734]NHZ96429.1 DUF2199 domain-containing protein [Massilia sp. CCM 8734]